MKDVVIIQGPNAILNTITLPPGATQTQARLVLDGIRGAIFLYKSGGPVGALIGSWSGMAGTDPYGNGYPEGLNVSMGNISGITFEGLNWILDSQGLFFYSGQPASGNLVASLAPSSGSDSFGNTFPAGFGTITGNNSSVLSGGQISFTFILATLVILSPAGLFIYASPGGAGNLIMSFAGAAGTDQFGNRYPAGLSIDSSGSVSIQSGATVGAFTGVLGLSQTDTATHSTGNVSSVVDITKAWSIPANDGALGNTYDVEIYGGGTWEGNTLTMGVSIDGAAPIAKITIGPGFLTAGATFNLQWKGRLMVTATGSGGTAALSTTGAISAQGPNISDGVNTNSLGIAGPTGSNSFDTTAAHTLAITAQWGGVATGQQLTIIGSSFNRIGA